MSDEAIVSSLFAAAGIEMSPHEMRHFVGTYPMIRGMVEALYSVDLGDEVPALVFDPAPDDPR
jgi:hypothetical protein